MAVDDVKVFLEADELDSKCHRERGEVIPRFAQKVKNFPNIPKEIKRCTTKSATEGD